VWADPAPLPDAPDLTAATRESKLVGKLELPNVFRPAARPGIAFIGDAALAADPVWGGRLRLGAPARMLDLRVLAPIGLGVLPSATPPAGQSA
jgi:hypothetical protein